MGANNEDLITRAGEKVPYSIECKNVEIKCMGSIQTIEENSKDYDPVS